MPEPPWANSPYVDRKYWFDPNPPEEAFTNLPKCCGKCKRDVSREEIIEELEERIRSLRPIIRDSEKTHILEKIDIIAGCLFDTMLKLKELVTKTYDVNR